MATTETPREIMAALIEGRKPRKRSKTVYVSEWNDDDPFGPGSPAIYSYGPHYPIAIMRGCGWWVNTEKYQLTTETYGHRAPGLIAFRPRQRTSYSVTTENHKRGVAEALYAAGYEPTDTTETFSGYRFQYWTKEES